MNLKNIIISMLLSSFAYANSCPQNYIKNGHFFYKQKMGKVYVNNIIRWQDKMLDIGTFFYKKCDMGSEKLFMYDYRTDLPKRRIIHFIFKSDNNFAQFGENFKNYKEIKEAIKNVPDDGRVNTLQLTNNNHMDIIYYIEHGKIVKTTTKYSGK